jgi:Short C-terminal domain
VGFHIYTDGWWRKHAVTTEATIVEAERGRQGGDSWMHIYWWTLVADVSDPETGQIVRGEGTTLTADVFQPGQTIKVRWSAKRKAFDLYSRSTVAEDEWEADAFGHGQGTTPIVEGTALADAELSPDQAARVQQALGALGLGNVSGVQVMRTQGAGAGGGQPDPIEQLEKLDQLRKSGALTDEEFEQQKRRVLGEQ